MSRVLKSIPPFWLALLVVFAVAMSLKVATNVDWVRWPTLSTLTVESALDSAVLVDVRTRARAGQVDGPIAQLLVPGSSVTFTASPDQPICIRLISREDRRITAFQLEGNEQATATAVRLGRSTLQRTPPGFVECDDALAQHRVRPTPGRYFDPDRPQTLRRERILTRDRL